jgi:N-terminal acetyltransferase B complex catalytic subunit
MSRAHVNTDMLCRYSVYRRVVNYYSDDPSGLSGKGEDAFDMRKPLSRDKNREHVRENGENFLVNPEDVS